MLRIKHIDHVVLRVVDVQKMLDFYIGVLGCSLEKVQHDIGLVQVRAGESLIDFVAVDGPLGKSGGAAPGRQGRNLDHFCISLEGPSTGAGIRPGSRAMGPSPGGRGTRAMVLTARGRRPHVSDPEGGRRSNRKACCNTAEPL